MKLINNSSNITNLIDLFNELNINDDISNLCNQFDKIVINDTHINFINHNTNKIFTILRIKNCSLEYKCNINNIHWIF
jgi:hypothetical protein